MTDHDLSDLLDRLGERTDVGTPPTAAMIARAARLRRRRTAVGAVVAAASVLAVVGGTMIVASTPTGDDGEVPEPGPETSAPTTEPVPAGMRLVAFGRIGILIPEGWATNATRCGTPTKETVVVDEGVVRTCLWIAPKVHDSVWVAQGAGSAPRDGESVTIGGLEASWTAARCEPDGASQTVCSGSVMFPDEGVWFRARSATAAGVDRILDRVTPVPDGQVGVPGTSQILYGRDTQDHSGKLYGDLLRGTGLQVRYLEEVRAAFTPDFILGVEPAPGTVVPVGSTVTVHVVGEPRGPRDEISVAMNSENPNVEAMEYKSLSDEQIKAGATIRLGVGWKIWLYGHGKRVGSLAGEVVGHALVLDDWKEGPNYGRSWDAVRAGTSTIRVTIDVDGEPFELGTVTVIVER